MIKLSFWVQSVHFWVLFDYLRTGVLTVTTFAVRTCLGTAATSPALGTLCVVSHLSHVRVMNIIILSISGKPHAKFELFAALIFGLGAIGSLTYSYAFKDREPRRKEKLK